MPPKKAPAGLNEQGLAPNSFTQASRGGKPVALPAPQNPRMPAADESHVKHMQATRAAGEHAQNRELLGWGGHEGIRPEWQGRFSGLQEHMPNVMGQRGAPAINQPHEATPGVPVMRRWEDMSGHEQGVGKEILRQQGFGGNGRDPMEHFTQNKTDQMLRHAARNNQAGTSESATQHFYGGAPVTTKIGDETLNKEHHAAMTEGPGKLDEMRSEIQSHPTFQDATRHLSAAQQGDAARAMAGQAIADTSPNLKYYQPKKDGTTNWPNIESARKGSHAALTGGDPEPGGQGFMNNRVKAKNNLQDMMATGNYDSGTRAASPKTGPFGGALVQPHSPDAFTVADVHESGSAFPGSTHTGAGFGAGKSAVHRDSAGARVERYPDEPESKTDGMERSMTTKKSAKGDVQIGMAGPNRGEAYLDSGTEGLPHAMNDYAARQSHAQLGISRGTEFADNAHSSQAARWGGEQLDRTDIQPSHGHIYPVVQAHGSDHAGAQLSTMLAARKGDAGAQHLVSQHQFGQVSAGKQYQRNPHMSHTTDPSTNVQRGGYLT
jgi:hypothetical protein